MHRARLVLTTTVSALLLAVLIAQIAMANSPAAASASATYYKTFTGTDFHSLNSDDVIRFAPGTGGGVWVKSSNFAHPYLETSVDLPPGAQITQIAFYVRSCNQTSFDPDIYAGAYAPSSGAYTHIITPVSISGELCLKQEFVFPMVPPVTVDNSVYRYVVGFDQKAPFASDINSNGPLLYGARVSYQLQSVFLPMVQR